jgi:hypothetical protein
MRGFPDFQSRDVMKSKFYDGPFFKQELEPILLPLLESWDVILVEDPAGDIRW